MENYSEYIIPAILVVAVILIIVISYYYSPKSRIMRQLKKVRRKPIHSVRENEYVKIVGKAKNKTSVTPLSAPLSKRPCVYYHVKVEKKGDKSWHTIIDDILFQDFYIQTTSESALVELNLTRKKQKLVHLVADHNAKSGFLKDADNTLEQYLQQHNKKSTNFLGLNRTLRYTERIIEIDEEIAVMGIGKWKTIDTPLDSYSDSRIVTLSGTEKQKLLVTDEPKAMEPVRRKL
ncbi:hypothetical protein C8N46_107141 [Kordia periserrulae]|uniref:RING-type E3 ubiquitin transferase n=1 Tax=Kordia periserrulae TaxID=701523 RepID=A0A2T6BVN0_9FLAO|nr:hypothetical protein [Kordia periserrulae]PTX60135.1 hypothetical protein C8N46_107141 [Kordia periserrulae]